MTAVTGAAGMLTVKPNNDQSCTVAAKVIVLCFNSLSPGEMDKL